MFYNKTMINTSDTPDYFFNAYVRELSKIKIRHSCARVYEKTSGVSGGRIKSVAHYDASYGSFRCLFRPEGTALYDRSDNPLGG